MPSERLSLRTKDGSFDAYVSKPEGPGPFPAVIVIQEVFGVNAVMRETADRLASEGFLAVAPDLFWRLQPGVDLTDQSEAEWKRAFELYNAFDVDQGVEDIRTTVDSVRADPECSGKVGAVGYCLGGLLAFLTATRTDCDATVGYYGVGIENHVGEAERLVRPLLLHVAEEDQFVPKAAQQQILTVLGVHPHATVHTYPGRDHAFARTGGQHFHADDARTANARTLAFFKEHLS